MKIAMQDQSHQTMPFWINFPKRYALISHSLSALPVVKCQLTVTHEHTEEFFICAVYRLKTQGKDEVEDCNALQT